jgi:hypothetical protein
LLKNIELPSSISRILGKPKKMRNLEETQNTWSSSEDLLEVVWRSKEGLDTLHVLLL